jgi:hypothetical protein
MPTSSEVLASGVRTRSGRSGVQGLTPRVPALASAAMSEPSTIHVNRENTSNGANHTRVPSPRNEDLLDNPHLGTYLLGTHNPPLIAPAPSPEDPENELAAVVYKLVSEMQEVQQALTESLAREDVLRREVESVRNVLTDLEGVVMRELVADRLEPELGQVTSNKPRSKKSKQKNSEYTSKGDPHNSHKAQVISDGDTSDEGGNSSDSDVDERPHRQETLADTTTTGANSQQSRRVPGLVTIKARRPEFRPLLNYRTYRLNDMRVEVTEKDTLRVNSLLKRMRHHLEYRYTGTPALKVIDFLTTFKEAMDVNRVCEGLAALLLPHALDGDARSGVQAFWKQNCGKVPKYVSAVNYLLESYATEAVIDQTTKAVLTATQAPGENEDTFASRLRRNAAEAGNVFTEDTLISVYIAGLHPYAANTVRGQVNPSTNFAAVRNLAIQAGAAGRARIPSQVSQMGAVPIRPKVTVASVDDSSSFGSQGFSYLAEASPIAAMEPSLAHGDPYESGSEMSIPTRGWNSAAGSAVDDAAFAIAPQGRSCFLCFGKDHFVMECPFLTPETKALVQQRRNAESPPHPSYTPRPPMGTSGKQPYSPRVVVGAAKPPFTPPRWEVNPRAGSHQLLRRPPSSAIHHVDVETDTIPKGAGVNPQSTENASGDA